VNATAARKADFLAACKATDSRNKALEEIRDKGAEIILATFRMLKNSIIHQIDNEAVKKIVAETHAILIDFAGTVGGYVAITFVDQTIFVCGQLLRATRGIYESAMEVGRLLKLTGVSELSFTGELTEQDLFEFLHYFSVASRDPAQRQALLTAKLNHMAVRAVDTSLQDSNTEDDNIPDMERALQAYASSLVVMRQFFRKMSQGRTVMPHRVKRISQRLVSLAEQSEGSLLGMTSLANAHRDEAGRSVQTAILSILVARKLTRNRTALSQIAMAALMADSGRVRIAGKESLDRFVPLAEAADAAVPALTASLFIATGGVNLANAVRTVTGFEATYMEREKLIGPVYGRAMQPSIQSKIVHAVRVLMNHLAPRDTARPKSPVDALAALSQDKSIDEVTYKLLVQAMGLMPTGTVVEFETGEWGIVLGPSKHKGAINKPRIKLVTDRTGSVFARPKEIDLGEPSNARRFPKITGIIEPSRARFNVSAVLMSESGATS